MYDGDGPVRVFGAKVLQSLRGIIRRAIVDQDEFEVTVLHRQ